MKNLSSLPTLLEKLEADLVDRNILSGFSILDELFKVEPALIYKRPEAISMVLCLAQWTDLGYRDMAFFENFKANFPRFDRSRLSVLDFLRWQLTEAYECLAREDLERAIALLDLVLHAGEGIMSGAMTFLTHFWRARAHRKKGEYALALAHIVTARECAAKGGSHRLVAVAKIHESWLVFQKGERRHAFQLLDEAEAVLSETGHALSMGNIESARGRFVRRSGEYARALRHFESAIEIYSENYPHHPNHARALVNAAYAKRLIALDMRPRQDGRQALGATNARYLQISREALELLRKAADIYSMHHHQAGTGSVLVNSGHLHLESGDIDRAASEAQDAYALGLEKNDQILMSRARILQTDVELARGEEQLGENPDVALHANRAVGYAEEAIELAKHTQNRRLLAEAYIARGSAAADEFFQEWETARDYADRATGLLDEDDRDHLLKELNALKAKYLRSNGIDQRLRLWSIGEVGNKTFQQIQEEFAELVIPKVWLKAGRNVTAVAHKLSISPKKIRRVLRNSRCFEPSTTSGEPPV